MERDDDVMTWLERTAIATVVTNPRLPDNPIFRINAAFTELTGYEEHEVSGRNCRFLAGAETEAWASRALGEAVRLGRPAFAELLNFKKSGEPFLNAVMIAPVRGPDGKLQWFVGSQMDVTEQATSVGRRREAGERLRRLTPRQIEVLQFMMMGLRNKQIAVRLGIEEKTVKMHRAGMLSNLEAATSPEAVRIAVEGGLAA